jgi:hypothetical protein
MSEVFYEDKLNVSTGVKLFWGWLPILMGGLSVLVYSEGGVNPGLFITCCALIVMALWLTPKRLLVMDDKIRIEFFFPFRRRAILFEMIESVKKLPKEYAIESYTAYRSSFSEPVEIKLKNGIEKRLGVGVRVTPTAPDEFVKEVLKAVEKWTI